MKARAHRRRLQQIVDYVFDGNVKAAAEAAGVEQPTLHRILAGKVKEPRISTLARLADRFGVPLAWILGEMPDQELGASERRDRLAEFLGGPPARELPIWWRLIELYHRTAQREDRAWLEAYAPRSDELQSIKELYLEFRRVDRTQLLFAACLGSHVTAHRAIPDGFLPSWRALLEFETRMTRLVRVTLLADPS